MGQQVVGHILGLAQHGGGTLQVSRVPQDDGGHDQVKAGCPVLLVFVGAVADLAQAVDEHRASQAVARLALVQLLAGRAAQLGVFDLVQREQGAFHPTQLAERRGDAVLPRVGGELAHDR